MVPGIAQELGTLHRVRLMCHYEHQGKDQGLDALAYNARLDMFMKDWQRWKMEGRGGGLQAAVCRTRLDRFTSAWRPNPPHRPALSLLSDHPIVTSSGDFGDLLFA